MTKNIAIATISLDKMAGGLEKNAVNLANMLSSRGCRVHLITLDESQKASSFFKISENVNWIKLGSTQPHKSIPTKILAKQIFQIRTQLKERNIDDLVVFTHGLFLRFLIATIGLKITLICSERNALDMYNHTKPKKWNKNFCPLFLQTLLPSNFLHTKIIIQFGLGKK